MKKLVLYSLISLMVINAVYGSTFVIDLKIHKNDTVTFDEISVYPYAAPEQETEGEYYFNVIDKEGNLAYTSRFDVSFVMFMDPGGPHDIDENWESLHGQYDESVSVLEVYHGDLLIYTVDLKDLLCNRDGVCNNYENELSCPYDCHSGMEDGICDGEWDNICDPDCSQTGDIDCSCGNGLCDAIESYDSCPEDCKTERTSGVPTIIGLIIALVLVAAVIYIVLKYMRKSKE